MRRVLLFCILWGLALTLKSQTYINLQDNYNVSSNTHLIINPGTYNLSDPGNDGLLRLNNVKNVIIEGPGVTADGLTYGGYLIKMNNCRNITIRNFGLAKHFYYAVHAMNSDSIFIYNTNFSYNKVDSAGWIDVWSDYQQALGGGVMLYNCHEGSIHNNTMQYQNDGVALYHCSGFELYENVFDWNTSFGIRMFFTDNCHIHHNQAAHINRPYTDPSDCAALLMIVSNNNLVEYNDLSWSGDGVFLGQYQYSQIPNNNQFYHNECSHSPHNAIEATFADGNIYKFNKCNYSHYGFWLGYSFNSIVDSNEVIGNYNSGIAIDRGFQNTIRGNVIQNNPIGIELWEGSNIPGYQNQWSHDYLITGNIITGNTKGIHASKTERLVVKNNNLDYNRDAAIYFEGQSDHDTIEGNSFRYSTVYHMRSLSTDNIRAVNNLYQPTGDNFIGEKILGSITWQPYTPAPPFQTQTIPLCDLTEPTALWLSYPELGYGSRQTETLTFDSTDKVEGIASLKLETGRGWYVALNYRPNGDTLASWSFSPQDTLTFWVKTIKNPNYGFQYFHLRLGNRTGGYYRYNASPSLLNAAHLNWKKYSFPLSGNAQFSRQTIGTVDLSDINYFELWADTWDYGFTLWLDGVSFSNCQTPTVGTPEITVIPTQKLRCNNPVKDRLEIKYYASGGPLSLQICNLEGRLLKSISYGRTDTGEINIELPWKWPAGMYILRITDAGDTHVQKILAR